MKIIYQHEKTLAAELLQMLSSNECPGQRFVLEGLMESLSLLRSSAPADVKVKMKQTCQFSSSHVVSHAFCN